LFRGFGEEIAQICSGGSGLGKGKVRPLELFVKAILVVGRILPPIRSRCSPRQWTVVLHLPVRAAFNSPNKENGTVRTPQVNALLRLSGAHGLVSATENETTAAGKELRLDWVDRRYAVRTMFGMILAILSSSQGL